MYPRLGLTALLVALAATLPASASAATNLGAFWHLNESSGAIAADSSGNGNTGTISGPAHVSGRFSRALAFDGVDDTVQIAQSATLEPSSVTVEAWVRGTNPGAGKYIFSKGAYLCEVASYGLYTRNGGAAFYISNGNDDNLAVSPEAPATIWNGQWHHLTGTYDGAAVRLFVDGAEVGNGTASTIPIGYALPVGMSLLGAFGGGPCPAGDGMLAYAGDIDEPRIWGRALGATEIAASAAMGGSATTKLDERIDSSQAIVYTSDFSDGDNMKISTEASTLTAEKITSIKLVGLIPVTSRATCRTGLLRSLLDSSCDYDSSNGGRTATLTVRGLLGGHPTVTLRVTVTSGRTFEVTVDT